MRLTHIPLALCLTLLAAPLAADWTRIGPDGGRIGALAAAPSRPALLYAAAEAGHVFRSLDRGRTWALVGRPGIFFDLAVDPQVPAILYGLGGGSLHRSTDGGASWSLVWQGPLMSRVELHPRTAGLVFVFGGLELFRSDDSGQTWKTRRNWPQNVQALAFDPDHSNVIYAGSSEGLFRSTDGGRTWSPRGHGLPTDTVIFSLAIDPRAPRTLWAGLAEGVYKSTDGGVTWKPSQRGLRHRSVVDLVVDPVSPSILYANAMGRLFRSTDRGASWTPAGNGLQGILVDLEATPYGLVAGTGTGVSLSTDHGLTWRDRQSGLTALAISDLAVDTQDPPRLYASTNLGGRIFKTPDRGASWQRLGPGPGSGELPVAVDPNDPEIIYTADINLIVRSTDGGHSWEDYGGLVCGDPFFLAADPRNPGTVYTSGPAVTSGCLGDPGTCLIARIDPPGESTCIRGGPGAFLGLDPFTSAVYGIGAVQGVTTIWKSTDRGATWSVLFEPMPGVVSFAASPAEEGTLFIGRQGNVARSRDGGQTWQFFTTGLPADDVVLGLAPDPVDPEVVYAGLLDHGVFRSTDGGETWSPLGSWPQGLKLSAGPVVDPADPSIVYAGTAQASVLRYAP